MVLDVVPRADQRPNFRIYNQYVSTARMLTHILLDKMTAISQTVFSYTFSCMERCVF